MEEEIVEELLPIGSVVRLIGGNKDLMITGYCMADQEDEDLVYDYCGCLYPEGVISSDENYIFDHDDIEEIKFVGYETEESKKYQKEAAETMSEENDEDEEAENASEETPTLVDEIPVLGEVDE